MRRFPQNRCDCETIIMADQITQHLHFCKFHGGSEKNFKREYIEAQITLDCNVEPDSALGCSCQLVTDTKKTTTLGNKVYTTTFTTEKKEKKKIMEIPAPSEEELRILYQHMKMYPGTKIEWLMHKTEYPIEITAPTGLEYPHEKPVAETEYEIEYVKSLKFSSFKHLIAYFKNGLRPIKTKYETGKGWVPVEPLVLSPTEFE